MFSTVEHERYERSLAFVPLPGESGKFVTLLNLVGHSLAKCPIYRSAALVCAFLVLGVTDLLVLLGVL